MPKYAIHDGTTVSNVIVAETIEIATSVTGLVAVETEGVPWIGWTLHGEDWRPPMPTEGVWEWDDTLHDWREIVTEPDAGE